jgi:translin
MHQLEEIAERIHSSFDIRTAARDRALSQTRALTRNCAHAIRATHRGDQDKAKKSLEEARDLVHQLHTELAEFPDLYYAGYTQDALKEYAEASIVFALLNYHQLPQPEELEIGNAAYLKGLAETVGELRRRVLDILIDGHSNEAEQLLDDMDEIYAVLVTMDYPDAVTGGLRRLTDIVRSIIERTRGDLLISLRNHQLEKSLAEVEKKLNRLNP